MPQVTGTDLTPCLLLQEKAVKYFGKLASDSQKPFVGVLDALESPINKVGTQITMDMNNGQIPPETGGKRKVQVRYIKPTCKEATDVEASECSIPASDDNEWGFDDVTIDDFVSFSLQLSETDFANFCEDRDTIYMENLMTRHNDAIKRWDKKLINAIHPLMGTYSTGTSSITSPITVPFLAPGNIPNLGAFNKVLEAFQNMGFSSTPIWVGDKKLLPLKQIQMQGALGLNNQGIDLSKLNLTNFYYDNQLDANIAGGNDNVLTWIPGTIQLVEYLDHKRKTLTEPMSLTINGTQVTRYKKQLDVINIEGRDWDMFYEYDCGLHKFHFQKRFGLFHLPVDSVCENKFPALAWLADCNLIDDCALLDLPI